MAPSWVGPSCPRGECLLSGGRQAAAPAPLPHEQQLCVWDGGKEGRKKASLASRGLPSPGAASLPDRAQPPMPFPTVLLRVSQSPVGRAPGLSRMTWMHPVFNN